MAKISNWKNLLGFEGMADDVRKFTSAALIFAAMSLYLYEPYFNRFSFLQFLVPVNVCIAALGCYVLSRRWIFSFWCSVFAGLLYGFSPLILRINTFHPLAALFAASIPWLFCPAVFGQTGKWKFINWILCAVPFLAVIAYFLVTTSLHLFTMPINFKLQLIDVVRLFAPTVKINGWPARFGFYHVSMAPLMMGLAMMIAARRNGTLAILWIGLVLAFSLPFLNVTPFMWATIPAVGFSIVIAEGMQGLAQAGTKDRKWVLTNLMILAGLSLIMMILTIWYASPFAQAARMYMLGAVVIATIYFMIRKMRMTWVKLLILCLAIGVDIFLGARYIVDLLY